VESWFVRKIRQLRLDTDAPREREPIEFVPATPLEHLSRWLASNEVLSHWLGRQTLPLGVKRHGHSKAQK
jgi:hypothetical protein